MLAAAEWGCGCPKAFERPRCTVEYSALSESWALYCRKLATTLRARWQAVGWSGTAKKGVEAVKRALEPYNANSPAVFCFDTTSPRAGGGLEGAEASRRPAARARPG